MFRIYGDNGKLGKQSKVCKKHRHRSSWHHLRLTSDFIISPAWGKLPLAAPGCQVNMALAAVASRIWPSLQVPRGASCSGLMVRLLALSTAFCRNNQGKRGVS